MRARKTRKRLLVTALLAIPAILVPATAANAASRSAGCTPDGFISFQGLGTTYYHLESGYDVVDYFEYAIHGENGSTQNDVTITHRPGGFQWNSPDNRVEGRTYTYNPTVTVRTRASDSTSTVFTFNFDRNNASDPSCSGTTARW